jgi:hypothetical protein
MQVDLDLEGFEDTDENGEETVLRYLMLLPLITQVALSLVFAEITMKMTIRTKKNAFCALPIPTRIRILWVWFDTYDRWIS